MQTPLWLPDSNRRMEWWEAFWRDGLRSFGEPSSNLMVFVAQAVESRPACRAVDIASGNGRYAIPLAQLGCSVTAIEWTESGVAKIESFAAESGIEIICERRNYLELVTQNRSYDIVFSSGLLEEVAKADQVSAIEGYCRWTAPGGVAIVVDFRPELTRD